MRHRQAERRRARIMRLRSGLQRMEAGALDVAEAAFQPVVAVESGTARQFHASSTALIAFPATRLRPIITSLIVSADGAFLSTVSIIQRCANCAARKAVSMRPASSVA